MITRRRFSAMALSAVSVGAAGAVRADVVQPTTVVQSLYDARLETMKDGEKLGFDGRYQMLEPVIHKVFDVATRSVRGIFVGAQTPPEIALSILAGLVAIRRGAPGGWKDAAPGR